MLRDLWQDLRFGLRSLRRSPAFAAMVVLSLGLGIGANAAIFSLVNAVLLRPLPVREPGRLVVSTDGRGGGRNIGVPQGPDGGLRLYSQPLYQRLRAQAEGLESLAAQDSSWTTSVVLRAGATTEGAPGRADGRGVTANFFGVLGVSPAAGRLFLPEDETAEGANPVVVLSHGYWQRRFGGDATIVGSRLSINGTAYTVVGITEPSFTGAEVGAATDFWVPLSMQAALTRDFGMYGQRRWWWLHLIGRLQPGVTAEAVEARLSVAARHFVDEFPELKQTAGPTPVKVSLWPGATGISGGRRTFQEPLMILTVAVGLLLLIVCLNVSHLLLARAISRQREMGIRAALGASRGRLVRQLLSEGLLLAVLGAAVGAVLSHWFSEGLLRVAGSGLNGGGGGPPPLSLDVGADRRVLAFIAGVALLVALVLGLAPAWHASRAHLQQTLTATARTVAGGPRRLVSRLLLVSQVAFSLVLLVGAGLLAGTLGRLREVNKGFDSEHVLLVDLNTQMAGISDEEAPLFYDELVHRVTGLPGAQQASLSFPTVLSRGRVGWGITFPGTSIRPLNVQIFVITPGYFDTLGMGLAAGRGLSADDRSNGQRVAVVNQTMARRAFGTTPAVGQRFYVDPAHDVEIVGIVKDARIDSMREDPRPAIYLPATQPTGLPGKLPLLGSLQVRAAGDPALLAERVRRVIDEVRPNLPVLGVRTIRAQLERTLLYERLLATLSVAFGLGALFLVCIGLYGVISQWASQRTTEIGVRMALGATAGRVRWLVLGQAFRIVLVGLALGLPAAVAASRFIESMLFGVRPMDPTTIGGAALAMVAVATLAAYLPAWRSSRVQPMTALRDG